MRLSSSRERDESVADRYSEVEKSELVSLVVILLHNIDSYITYLFARVDTYTAVFTMF